MPPLPTIPNTYRVALEWSGGAVGHAVNVIHISAGIGGTIPSDVFTSLDTHVTRPLWDAQSDSVVVSQVAITPLDGVSATQTFSTGSPTKWTGNGGSSPTPAVANLIKLQTASRGRSFRGRIFLPFVAEGEMANGLLDSTARTTIESTWQALQASLLAEPAEFSIVVASYKLRSATTASLITAELALATQRRRQERLR